jgi:diguanylate cyclase (GGDEF)-like protein/PAS domain S-box-containing protein
MSAWGRTDADDPGRTRGGGVARPPGLLVLKSLLRDRGPAGTLARRTFPVALAGPPLLALLCAALTRAEVVGAGAHAAILAVGALVLTLPLLSSAILTVARLDRLRRERERAFRASEHLNRSIIEASPDCVSILDLEGRVLFVNRAALAAYGLNHDEELRGRPWGHRLSPADLPARDTALAAAQGGALGRLTLSLPGPDGVPRWYESLVAQLPDAQGRPVRLMVMSRDITQQKSTEERVRWNATHDPLTGLPNRALFNERLDAAIHDGAGSRFALLLLDIDDFKQVNDTLGHDAGDALLCTVAARLRRALRPEDLVARLGGDEFAIILSGAGTEAAAAAAGRSIFEALKEPWIHNGRVADCRVSVGASLFGVHGSEASELLKNADIALYSAKLRDRGRIAVFQSGMRAKLHRRSAMVALARSALAEDRVAPFYQPKVDLASGRILGFEALLRWRHPTRGYRPPATIAAAFEDLEVATELTDRMLERALRDMREWRSAGLDFGHVAINASAADFRQGAYAERLIERLEAAGIPPECFQVEITETVFLGRGADYVERALKTLSANGIRIALDDFGTGYASLSHLKQFPVDIVKVDRSFVADIGRDAHNAAIIGAVVNLGRSLQLEVVAEGIETAAQRAWLLSRGCRFGQGYLFGRAARAERVPRLLRAAEAQMPRADAA